jgi:fibronectin-binding autotransporter adhesin
MKIRHLSFGSILLGLFAFMFLFTPHAFAATRTWTGAGSDSNLSTAANWGGTAPVAGDDLIFPAGPANKDVTNDLVAGTSFNSISFSGDGYDLLGNAIVLVAGITNSAGSNTVELDSVTLSAPQSFINSGAGTGGNLDGLNVYSDIILGSNNLTLNPTSATTNYIVLFDTISGSGGLIKNGAGNLIIGGFSSNAYTGTTLINAGWVNSQKEGSLGTVAGGTTVASGASLVIDEASPTVVNFAEPLTLSGSGNATAIPGTPLATLWFEPGLGGAGECQSIFNINYTGDISLQTNDVVIDSSACMTFSLRGTVSGSGGLNYTGKQLSLDGTIAYTGATTVTNKTLVEVDASSSDFTIANGGILGGSGTTGDINAQSGSTLASGNSPGCLNSGNLTLVSGSTFEEQIAGNTVCSEYDQVKVTGTVTLGNATLSTLLLNGFKPTAGKTFIIIDNDGADAVTGTFTGLAEGATFSVSGYVFKISYTGGDGNDVVLSVVSVPAVPNTGFSLVAAHPLISLLGTTLAAGGIFGIAQRTRKVPVRVRR